MIYSFEPAVMSAGQRSPCVRLPPTGSRKKEQLLREEQEEHAGGGQGSERNMDISLLREQYRSTRERQRRHTQVFVFRTGERKRFVYLQRLKESSYKKQQTVCFGEKRRKCFSLWRKKFRLREEMLVLNSLILILNCVYFSVPEQVKLTVIKPRHPV